MNHAQPQEHDLITSLHRLQEDLVRDLLDRHSSTAAVRLEQARQKELQHRLRNHLQSLSNTFYLQAQEEPSPSARAHLLRAVERLKATFCIEESLLSTGNPARLELEQMLPLLVSQLFEPEQIARLTFSLEKCALFPHRAEILALILAELLANAFHHGTGTVKLIFRRQKGDCLLSVENSYLSCPEASSADSASGFGLQISAELTETGMKGCFSFEQTAGTAVSRVQFSLLPGEIECQPPI